MKVGTPFEASAGGAGLVFAETQNALPMGVHTSDHGAMEKVGLGLRLASEDLDTLIRPPVVELAHYFPACFGSFQLF